MQASANMRPLPLKLCWLFVAMFWHIPATYAIPLVNMPQTAEKPRVRQQSCEYLCAQVTCGSVIKLQHANTGVNLHSHEISYGSGSGQQSVTGYTGGDDANDYWAVRGVEVSRPYIAQAEPASCKTLLTLCQPLAGGQLSTRNAFEQWQQGQTIPHQYTEMAPQSSFPFSTHQ